MSVDDEALIFGFKSKVENTEYEWKMSGKYRVRVGECSLIIHVFNELSVVRLSLIHI